MFERTCFAQSADCTDYHEISRALYDAVAFVARQSAGEDPIHGVSAANRGHVLLLNNTLSFVFRDFADAFDSFRTNDDLLHVKKKKKKTRRKCRSFHALLFITKRHCIFTREFYAKQRDFKRENF